MLISILIAVCNKWTFRGIFCWPLRPNYEDQSLGRYIFHCMKYGQTIVLCLKRFLKETKVFFFFKNVMLEVKCQLQNFSKCQECPQSSTGYPWNIFISLHFEFFFYKSGNSWWINADNHLEFGNQINNEFSHASGYQVLSQTIPLICDRGSGLAVVPRLVLMLPSSPFRSYRIVLTQWRNSCSSLAT